MTEEPTTPPASGTAEPHLAQRAARGTGITLAVQASRTLVQFGTIVLLARLLVPEDFGLVAMVTSVIGIADLVRDFGLSVAAIQSPTLSTGERDNLFWANLASGLGCTIIAAALTPVIVHGYGEPRLTPVVLSLAMVFTVSGFITQFKAGLARDMRFKAIGLIDFTAQIVAGVVAISMAFAGFGMWALVWQQIVNAVTTAVMSVWKSGWWPGLPRRQVSIRRFLHFGIGVFGTQGISYVTKNIDNVAIGAVWGAGPLGVYSRAYQLMMMPLNQINAPMTNVALPVLARVQREDETFLRYLRKSQLVACYITATIFAVSAGLSRPIVLVLFGPDWTAVIPIFAVLALGGVFRAVAQIAYWAYLARGRSGALFRQRVVTGVASTVCILAGVPWGPVGVAVGATIGSFISWLVAVWHVGRVTGLDTRPLVTNAVAVVCLVGTPAGLAAYLATWIGVAPILQLLLGVVFAGLYVLVAYAAVPRVRGDINLTVSFAYRAVRRSRPRPRPVSADAPAPS